MIDQIRKLAAEALKVDFPSAVDGTQFTVGYVRGFIAGCTSVTREQILEAVAPFMHDEFVKGQETPADEECADAILALLNGENDV